MQLHAERNVFLRSAGNFTESKERTISLIVLAELYSRGFNELIINVDCRLG